MTAHSLPVPGERPSLVRLYVLGVGALLLVQGAASFGVEVSGRDAHMTTRLLSDPRHAAIHVLWGAALLAVLALRHDDRSSEVAALVFGIFYVALLVVGLAVHHPFGLMIDGKENVFHAVIGPPALILGLWAVVRRRSRRHPEGP